MKLKKHEYLIVVEYNCANSLLIKSNFVIKAVPVTLAQAKKIAKILFPRPEYKNVRIVDCVNL